MYDKAIAFKLRAKFFDKTFCIKMSEHTELNLVGNVRNMLYIIASICGGLKCQSKVLN